MVHTSIYRTTSSLCFSNMPLFLFSSPTDNPATKDKEFFIKIISIPITITLFLTIVSFSLFVENIHDAGFVDTYSFRFLFTPIGYFTNAWSSICFLLLGIIIYSYYNMPHWRIFFGIIGAITLIIILLSFSRAAIIAWSIYFSFFYY